MKDIVKKWWFWLIILTTIIVISSTAIVLMGCNIIEGGIHKIAKEVQNIDEEATVYTSAEEDVIIVKIDEPSLEQMKKIEETIKYHIENSRILSNYSKMIIYSKMKLDNNYYLVSNVYKLPTMEQIVDEEEIWIDNITQNY